MAIEIVRKLEAEGKHGELILIDGSPDLIKDIQIQHFASNSDEELQSNILLGMMDIVSPTQSAEVKLSLNLLRNSTWNMRILVVNYY